MQTSESFRLSAILSFSGGLQDAYTYNVRGNVFANAQTGNVVLMSQNFMMGNWSNAIHYVLPLISFAAGVFLTEQIEYRFKNNKRLHWRQVVLIIEILLLGAVGFMPEELNVAANMMVSFSCAMQVQAFRKVHGYGYASTMCIGNLRSGTESLSHYLRDQDRSSVFCDWCRGGRYYVEGVPGKDDMDFDAPAGCRYGYDGERDGSTVVKRH